MHKCVGQGRVCPPRLVTGDLRTHYISYSKLCIQKRRDPIKCNLFNGYIAKNEKIRSYKKQYTDKSFNDVRLGDTTCSIMYDNTKHSLNERRSNTQTKRPQRFQQRGKQGIKPIFLWPVIRDINMLAKVKYLETVKYLPPKGICFIMGQDEYIE